MLRCRADMKLRKADDVARSTGVTRSSNSFRSWRVLQALSMILLKRYGAKTTGCHSRVRKCICLNLAAFRSCVGCDAWLIGCVVRNYMKCRCFRAAPSLYSFGPAVNSVESLSLRSVAYHGARSHPYIYKGYSYVV